MSKPPPLPMTRRDKIGLAIGIAFLCLAIAAGLGMIGHSLYRAGYHDGVMEQWSDEAKAERAQEGQEQNLRLLEAREWGYVQGSVAQMCGRYDLDAYSRTWRAVYGLPQEDSDEPH